MFRRDSGSVKKVAAVLGIFATAAMFACATSQPTDDRGASDGSAAVVSQELTEVTVDSVDGQTVIKLQGLHDPAYSTHRIDEDNVLVIELPGVSQPSGSLFDALSESDNQISVYDGLVDRVSTSTYMGDDHPVTRVEVGFATLADFEVVAATDGLEVWIHTPVETAELVEDYDLGLDTEPDEGLTESIEDPWAVAESLNESDEGGMAMADADAESLDAELESEGAEAIVPANAAPAKVLNSVSVQATETGTLLHLVADGMLTSAETFTLENPDRLVVDLPGITNGGAQQKIAIDSEWVESIRIGSHATKLRVVLDGGPNVDGFQGRRLIPAANGLILTVGSGTDLDDALAQSLEQMAGTSLMAAIEDEEITEDWVADETPVEETTDDWVADETLVEVADETPVEQSDDVQASAEVYGLQYDRSAERDRIAVLSDRVIDYQIHQPDAETVVISIPNAMLAESVGERITPELGGPVSLVTSFMQPDLEGNEVRVVVRRAPNLEPKVVRRGSLLFVDFENTGVAAAPPPAFIPGETQGGAAGEKYANEMQISDPQTTGPAAPLEGEMPVPMAGPEADGGSNVVAMGARGEAVASVLDEQQGSLPNFDAGDVPLDGGSALENDWKGSAAAAIEDAPSPAALEPPAAVEILEEGGLIDGKEYVGRRISLDFKNVAIADVLRLIAEVSDLNIIAGDEVAGSITIRLVDVPWDQALDVILLTKGLGFVRVGNVLRIAPSEILKVEEEVRLQERRNKEKLEDLEVKLQPINYANVGEAAEIVRRLLSPRGTVNTDKRTNTLIIKDISSVIDEAIALVQAIDTQTPQVMIEAKIVEAGLEFGRELGSVWSVGSQPYVDGFNPGTPRSDLGGQDFKFQGENNIAIGNPITSGATGLVTFGAFLLDEKMAVDVQIQAMEKAGEGKVISSPRIVTLDNRQAVIEQGVSIPFQTFEGGDAKLEFVDAVLSLNVTPHITSDRSIIMKIEVTRNAPDASVSTPTGSPAIAKNQAKTETLVKDGQTLVIGGIYTVDKTQRESRVPYLHKIPVLGAAFKSREISDIRKELLIFVTPRIVVNPEMAAN
ncbi:MAG: type IV pilus secretin PilQ [Deltaproteobacteria bacterium]|nr:type IV pilus secretin PilQ [Deltaproteobacteria bacterium]